MTTTGNGQRDELVEIKARIEGHTQGPWHNRGDVIAFEAGASLVNLCEAPQKESDAELIAAAPKLIAALEAVEGLAGRLLSIGQSSGAQDDFRKGIDAGYAIAALAIKDAIAEALA